MYNGQEIDIKHAPKDLCIPDKAQLFVFGSLSEKVENIASFSSVRWYRRFREIRGDGWYIGRDRWDAVTFIPNRDVKIFGIGIFEPYPQQRRDFKYGYKYVIKDAADADVFTSEVFEEEVTCPLPEEITDHIIQHRFINNATGVLVRAGQKYVHASWIAYNDGHNRCFYAESGDRPREVENTDTGLFDVADSSLSSNSTRVNRGIVPGLLYTLA